MRRSASRVGRGTDEVSGGVTVGHPLIELASGREVRQAAAFRKAAAELDGPQLAAAYAEEKASAPHLQEEGKRYFVQRSGKPATERRHGKDAEHVGQALVRHCREAGASLPLPDDDFALLPLDGQVRVRTGPQEEVATRGIARIDLLGLTSEGRLAVVGMRVLEPGATRCGVGDTPLRALLETLAGAAVVDANRQQIAAEVSERFGRSVDDLPPLLVLLATPNYWQLCRKREAQKGAAWIKEMERLAGEIESAVGTPVRFLGLDLPGDPGWRYGEEGPGLEGGAKLALAWEPGAGRVRPKPKSRPKPRATAQADVVVEADPSRPVRPYSVRESYAPGDRIEHPKLGLGVVQAVAGPNKVRVRFDGRAAVLVHERA
jgi:hypothetical protein